MLPTIKIKHQTIFWAIIVGFSFFPEREIKLGAVTPQPHTLLEERVRVTEMHIPGLKYNYGILNIRHTWDNIYAQDPVYC